MMDIVERLRDAEKYAVWDEELYTEAADEIERLREWNREIGMNAKFYASEVERLQTDVANAMNILLSNKQIKYIKSKTFAGLSRKQLVRKFINIGIEKDQYRY